MTHLPLRVARKFLASRFAYHGTRSDRLTTIKSRGLIPGAAASFNDAYSEYDDGAHLFFSDDPDYIKQHYGNVLLRFPWPADTKPDQNKYGRFLGHQFVSKKKVGPDDIEVEVDGAWVALKDL